MMTADPPTPHAQPLPTYSPQEVRAKLRLLPYMLDMHPPKNPALLALAHSLGYRSWPADTAADFYAMKEALHWLWLKDEWAENAVRLYYCVGMTTRDIAAAFRKHGRDVTNVTVWRWCYDGTELMGFHLGWRGDPERRLHPFKHGE